MARPAPELSFRNLSSEESISFPSVLILLRRLFREMFPNLSRRIIYQGKENDKDQEIPPYAAVCQAALGGRRRKISEPCAEVGGQAGLGRQAL